MFVEFYDKIRKKKHKGSIIESKNEYNIIDCEHCGFSHAVPIHSNNELKEFYKNKYYDSIKKDYCKRQQKQIDWWNSVFSERISVFENMLKRKGSVVDIGCGCGFFLDFAKSKGWKVTGIEPSLKASKYATEIGIEVINTDLENILEIDKAGFKTDVVYSHGVLEHLANPFIFFEFSRRILNEGGLVFCSVANDFNPFQITAKDVLGLPSYWVVPPEHINYFNIETIRQLFISQGFEILKVRTTFPIDMFLLMDEDYINYPEKGPLLHEKIVQFEKNLKRIGKKDLLDKIYTSFANIGIGRQIEVLGRRIEG